MPKLLALGMGYTAKSLAARLLQQDWSVTGTTRAEQGVAKIEAVGATPLVWTSPYPVPRSEVETADVIVVSVAPDEAGCPVVPALPRGALRQDALVLYLSATSVYGDRGGEWIDENAECRPTTRRGRDRVLAEAAWQGVAAGSGARVHLCRIAGIYGPGRSALASVRGQGRGGKAGLGQQVIKPGHVFNRIHRDDIVNGLMALIGADDAPMVINFADDEPSPPQDVIKLAAEIVGVATPPAIPFAQAQLSPQARSFYADNKRLKNDRLKALPGMALSYPSYREGLRAIAAETGLGTGTPSQKTH